MVIWRQNGWVSSHKIFHTAVSEKHEETDKVKMDAHVMTVALLTCSVKQS